MKAQNVFLAGLILAIENNLFSAADALARETLGVTFKYEYWSVNSFDPVRERNVPMGRQCVERDERLSGFSDAYTCSANGDLQFRSCDGDCSKPLEDCLIYSTIPVTQNGTKSTSGKLVSRYTWSCPSSVTVPGPTPEQPSAKRGEFVEEYFGSFWTSPELYNTSGLPVEAIHGIIASPTTETGIVPERCFSGNLGFCNRHGVLYKAYCLRTDDCSRPISEGCFLRSVHLPDTNGPLQGIREGRMPYRTMWTCPFDVVDEAQEEEDASKKYNVTVEVVLPKRVLIAEMGKTCQVAVDYLPDVLFIERPKFGYYCSSNGDLEMYQEEAGRSCDVLQPKPTSVIPSAQNGVVAPDGSRYIWTCNYSSTSNEPAKLHYEPPPHRETGTVPFGEPCPVEQNRVDGYAYTCSSKGDLEIRKCGLFACLRPVSDCPVERTIPVSSKGVLMQNLDSKQPEAGAPKKEFVSYTWNCPPSV